MALRASDGKLLWQQEAKVKRLALLDVAPGKMCVLMDLGGDGYWVYAYRTDTGILSWKDHLSDLSNFDSLSARVMDNILFLNIFALQSGFDFRAVNADTGELLWGQQEHLVFDGSYPYPLAVAQGVVVIEKSTTSSGLRTYLAGLRISDGQQVWQFETTHATLNSVGEKSALFSENGILYFSTNPFNNHSATDLFAVHTTDGRVLWRHRLSFTQQTTLEEMQLAHGRIYVGVNLSGSRFSAPQQTNTFSLTVLQANTGVQLWQQSIAHQLFSPSIAVGENTALFVRDGRVLDVLNQTDGAVLQHYSLPSEQDVNLFVAGDVIIFSYVDGNEHFFAFEQDKADVLWQKEAAVYGALMLGP